MSSSSCTKPKTRQNHSNMEIPDKRQRRETANNNERRRMQSINAGYESLRVLLHLEDGKKFTKAALLRKTAEYISQLEEDKTRLLYQNDQLTKLLNLHGNLSISQNNSTADKDYDVALKKYNYVLCKSTKLTEEQINEKLNDLQLQLNSERSLRMHLEEKLQKFEELFSDRFDDATDIVMQYQGALTDKNSPSIIDSVTAVCPSDLQLHSEITDLDSEVGVVAESVFLEPDIDFEASFQAMAPDDEASIGDHLDSTSKSSPIYHMFQLPNTKPRTKVLVERIPTPTSFSFPNVTGSSFDDISDSVDIENNKRDSISPELFSSLFV